MSKKRDEELLINEVKLLLAEKRTYFAIFRTGVAIFGLALSALGVLFITVDFEDLLVFDVPLAFGVALFLVSVAGAWLMYTSEKKIGRINTMVHQIENEDKRVAEIVV